MRIDLNDRSSALHTSLFYGVYRSGKTHLCCTFPRVAWLGAEREGGFETIRWMDPAHFYERDRPPQVYAVNTPADLILHWQRDIAPQVKAGNIKTIVAELSFYGDEMIRARASEATWHKYVDLEAHVTWLDAEWKKIPGLRVVYNTLAATEDDPKKPSAILMPGRQLSRKLPAGCDLVGYMRQEENGGEIDRVLHLQAHGNFPAGHRYATRLPPIIRNPTFKKIEACLHGAADIDANGNVTVKAAPAVALSGLPPLR